jgi:hypothetical protein
MRCSIWSHPSYPFLVALVDLRKASIKSSGSIKDVIDVAGSSPVRDLYQRMG